MYKRMYAPPIMFTFLVIFMIIFMMFKLTQSQQQREEKEKVATDGASLQRYLAMHDMESLHKALSIRFHDSERMLDVHKRITPLPPNKIQRGSGLDFTTKYKLEADLEQILYLIEVKEEQLQTLRNIDTGVQHNKHEESSSSSFTRSLKTSIQDKLKLFHKVKDVYQRVLTNMPSDDQLELTSGGYYKFQQHDIEAGILEYYNRALYRPETDDERFIEYSSSILSYKISCSDSHGTADNPDILDVDSSDGYTKSSAHEQCSANDNSSILNPNLNWQNIEKEYFDQDPQVVVIDNILTEKALHNIRQILLESTVFYQTKRRNQFGGYTGAYIDDGLHDRILLQLTTELRNHLPTVLKTHPLRYLWAYKYDSTYNGIKLHADMAAVNVNLWITPNESNLDPNSGGLVVFTVKPPADWDILQYNSDTDKVYEDLLKPAGMKNVTIPYRENRAVLFDSALFHQTDKFYFKQGYPNRRINLTILYGDMKQQK